MEIPPGLKNFLEKIGVNTTRLQWRLYERERQRAERRERRGELPPGLSWLNYKHKFCANCGGLVDRSQTICPSCGHRVPPMAVYRALRAIGLVIPAGGAPVVLIFLGVIVFLYLAEVVLNLDRGLRDAIFRPDIQTLVRFGMHDPWLVREGGEWWRLLSAGIGHAGLMHILFNTIAITQVGPLLESELGSKRMLVLITVCQLTAAFAVEISLLGAPGSVGASGWLFGLIGFGIAWYHRRGRSDLRGFFVQWGIYGLIFGFLFRFNNDAHVGGLLGGLIMGAIADITEARRTVWTPIWRFLFWPSLAVWLATLFFLAGSILGLNPIG